MQLANATTVDWHLFRKPASILIVTVRQDNGSTPLAAKS